MKLNVNLITKGHFWDAGVDVPQHLIPVWCIRKHRSGDVEAAEICRRREELRAEARERREKMEAKKAAKPQQGRSMKQAKAKEPPRATKTEKRGQSATLRGQRGLTTVHSRGAPDLARRLGR